MTVKKVYEIMKALDNLKGDQKDKDLVRDFVEKALNEYIVEDDDDEEDDDEGDEESKSKKVVVKEIHHQGKILC